MTRRDPVTPEMAAAVLARDLGCIAPWIDPGAEPCRGRPTMEHVQDAAGMGKPRAKSDMAHLVTLCEFHHLGSHKGRVWATANKAYTRLYLRLVADHGRSAALAAVKIRRSNDLLETYQ